MAGSSLEQKWNHSPVPIKKHVAVLRTDMLGILKRAWARGYYGKSIF